MRAKRGKKRRPSSLQMFPNESSRVSVAAALRGADGRRKWEEWERVGSAREPQRAEGGRQSHAEAHTSRIGGTRNLKKRRNL